MKPRSLVWVADDKSLQVPEIPTRLVKKRVSVPRRGAEIPKVRHYEEKNPEQKER